MSRCRSPQWSIVTDPFHGSPHTFGDHVRQKWVKSHLPIFSWQFCKLSCNNQTMFHHFLFRSGIDDSIAFCFPSFDSVESFLAPRPIFAPTEKITVDVFLHPSALHYPRHVFASADLHISPPSLVCSLASSLDGSKRSQES